MNAAHLHLVVAHIPTLGSLFGLFLLVLALLQTDEKLKKTSLWVFVLSGVAAAVSYLTGRPANALLVKLTPGMIPDPGDQHAEVAVLALTASTVLAVLALGGVLFYRKGFPLPRWIVMGALGLALLTTAMMAWTASLGGRICHHEINAVTDPGTTR